MTPVPVGLPASFGLYRRARRQSRLRRAPCRGFIVWRRGLDAFRPCGQRRSHRAEHSLFTCGYHHGKDCHLAGSISSTISICPTSGQARVIYAKGGTDGLLSLEERRRGTCSSRDRRSTGKEAPVVPAAKCPASGPRVLLHWEAQTQVRRPRPCLCRAGLRTYNRIPPPDTNGVRGCKAPERIQSHHGDAKHRGERARPWRGADCRRGRR